MVAVYSPVYKGILKSIHLYIPCFFTETFLPELPLYCNILHKLHKCLNAWFNPLLVLTIKTDPGLFSPQVFSWIYFGPSHSVENGDSHMPGMTRPIGSVPLRSSCSWRIFQQTEGWAAVWLDVSQINTNFCTLSPPCTCITIHSIQPSSLTTPFLRYPLSIATSYPSCCLLLSCSLSPVEK